MQSQGRLLIAVPATAEAISGKEPSTAYQQPLDRASVRRGIGPAFAKSLSPVSVVSLRGEVHVVLGHQCHFPLEHPHERDARLGQHPAVLPNAMPGLGPDAGSRDSRVWLLPAM